MRLFALILTFFTVAFTATGQTYFTSTELGFTFGGSQYFGDLNDNYGFKTIHPLMGIYGRKHINQYISLRLEGDYTHLGYSDKYNSNPYEKQRNLDFQTDIYELGLHAEFNFFRFTTGDPYYRFTPYLTGGIGLFYYDPYTYLNGTKYFLQPLGTEGQNAGFKDRKYSNVAVCFPIGMGVKFWLKGGINLSLEIADRLTTTDHIDDVSATYVGASKFPPNSPAAQLQDRSDPNNPLGRAGKQRGNTSSMDQYVVGQVSISFHFKTYHCPASLSDEAIRTY